MRQHCELITGFVAGVVMVLGTLAFWPGTTYVVNRGASMRPGIANGDLVVTRSAGSYRIGDVAAYRNAALHRLVVHRVVRISGDSYTFRGDANGFDDPQAVHRSDIAGRSELRVPYAGSVLLWLSNPINALLLLALALLLVRDRRRPVVQELDDVLRRYRGRVLPISDMSFPHELAIAEVPDADSLLRLAARHDRPVLHDGVSRTLFVVEGSMLFRCQLQRPKPALALVTEPTSGRRPSARGRDWRYEAK
jgi:signal peptidase I